jgi:hypothetical protein
MANTLLFIILIGTLFVLFMTCYGRFKEGLSHRLTTTRVLEDNTYGKSILPDYTQKWDYGIGDEQVESYTPSHDCRQECRYSKNDDVCYQQCMNAKMMLGNQRPLRQECEHDDHCGSHEVCVKSAPYTGGHIGYCMNELSPGVPQKENFAHSGRCDIGYFFNEATNSCQPRFQTAMMTHPITAGPRVSIPGSTLQNYGVGTIDPANISTSVSLS